MVLPRRNLSTVSPLPVTWRDTVDTLSPVCSANSSIRTSSRRAVGSISNK